MCYTGRVHGYDTKIYDTIDTYDHAKMEDAGYTGFRTVEEFWTTYGPRPGVSNRWYCAIEWSLAYDARQAAMEEEDPTPWYRRVWPAWRTLWWNLTEREVVHPRRLEHFFGRLRRGWGFEDAWSIDTYLADIMYQVGLEYIARDRHVFFALPGFAEWVNCVRHLSYGCSCEHAEAALNAMPDIFQRLWD